VKSVSGPKLFWQAADPDGMGIVTTFSKQFLADTCEILDRVDDAAVEAVVEILSATRERGGRVFFAGSGGGAGHASHATCDFRKLAGIEAYSVTDNVSELTARVNDDGWNSAYAKWLQVSKFCSDDCLFVFSVGGGSIDPPVSSNLVESAQLARSVGASVVGVVGRDGGAVARLADACIVVPNVDPRFVTPQTEGLQAVFWHLIVSHPALARSTAKWEGLDAAVAPGI
jgi:D-sedoheptulose 7-phosphate isomerase